MDIDDDDTVIVPDTIEDKMMSIASETDTVTKCYLCWKNIAYWPFWQDLDCGNECHCVECYEKVVSKGLEHQCCDFRERWLGKKPEEEEEEEEVEGSKCSSCGEDIDVETEQNEYFEESYDFDGTQYYCRSCYDIVKRQKGRSVEKRLRVIDNGNGYHLPRAWRASEAKEEAMEAEAEVEAGQEQGGDSEQMHEVEDEMDEENEGPQDVPEDLMW